MKFYSKVSTLLRLLILLELTLSPSAMPTSQLNSPVDCEKCREFNVLDERHSLCSFGCSFNVRITIPENADSATLEELANRILPLLRIMRTLDGPSRTGQGKSVHFNPVSGQLEVIHPPQPLSPSMIPRKSSSSSHSMEPSIPEDDNLSVHGKTRLAVKDTIPKPFHHHLLVNVQGDSPRDDISQEMEGREDFDWTEEMNSFGEDETRRKSVNSPSNLWDEEEDSLNEIPHEIIDPLTKNTVAVVGPQPFEEHERIKGKESNLLEMFYNEDSSLLKSKRFKKD